MTPSLAAAGPSKERPHASHRRLRRFWLRIHLYLALLFGLPIVLMGLTGSCTVFWVEIDELLNPKLVVKSAHGPMRGLDELLQVAQDVNPTQHGSWTLAMPLHERGMVTVIHQPDGEVPDAPQRMVSINPYTAEVVANRVWGETLTTWLYTLHNSLLLGRGGFYTIGVLGIILMVSLVSGLYLWWPRGSKFKYAFSIKRGASGIRLVFDIHRVAGIYTVAVLLAISFSGIYFVFGDTITSIVKAFSKVEHLQFQDPKGLKSFVLPCIRPISATQAVALSNQVFPNATLRYVVTPDGPEGVYRVDRRQPGEANTSSPVSSVWLDQYSGQLITTRDPNRYTAGETFLNVLWPIHNGEAFGLPNRIVNALAGFAPLILYVTGVIQWLRKRDKSSI